MNYLKSLIALVSLVGAMNLTSCASACKGKECATCCSSGAAKKECCAKAGGECKACATKKATAKKN